MKNLLLVLLCCGSFAFVQAQTLEELKSMQADKLGMMDDLQAQIDAAQGEVDALQKEIDLLSGWRKGVSGIVGFDWNRTSGWVANPNPDTRTGSLGIDLAGYLLNDKEKTFWHNKGNLVKAWNDIDITQEDFDAPDDGLFNNGTIDLLNISSLAGYKFTEKLAASGQAELNTSLGNFLKPGTLDLGLGVTWLPIENMTVMVHPLDYNVAFPVDGSVLETSGSIGAKVRVDYFRDFVVSGKNVNWTTTFTTYFPYTSLDPIIDEASGTELNPKVNNYTWLNNLSFEVWRGIGVGVGWGLRKADFESDDLQSYTSLGLSYNIK